MTITRNTETRTESETLFFTIGKYVVFFQWMESVIDQCLLLLWGHENWSESQNRLTGMRNHDKVVALFHEFQSNPANLKGQNRPEWCDQFKALIDRVDDERRQRNVLLHSQYIFDFLEIGQPIVQSDRRRRNGEWTFVRQDLSHEAQAALLDRVAQLAIDLGRAHIQIVNDFAAVGTELTGAPK